MAGSQPLTGVQVACPHGAGPIARRAAERLAHVLSDRVGSPPPIVEAAAPGAPAITLEVEPALGGNGDAFSLVAAGSGPLAVTATAATERGLFYAAGELLRRCDGVGRRATIDTRSLPARSVPVYPLRGHQIGYRDTPNSYDAWTPETYAGYVEELMLMGVNAIELTPTVDPKARSNAVMPLPPWEGNIAQATELARLDMQVWLWLPADDGDPRKPGEQPRMRAARRSLFEALPRVDAVFVPGGDPGDLPAETLLDFCAAIARDLAAVHPGAGIWVSPQGFDAAQMARFYAALRLEPAWLAGVVHGPWVRDTEDEVRAAVPDRYPLRIYPDICHTVRCQYPVRAWDSAWANTLNREPVCPRPTDMAAAFRQSMVHAVGAITYSEGITDDVNKACWAAMLWHGATAAPDPLDTWAALNVPRAPRHDVRRGLLDLEQAWRRRASARGAAETADRWRVIADAADPGGASWRVQLHAWRAEYDLLVHERAVAEEAREARALELLREAPMHGSEETATLVRSALRPPSDEGAAIRATLGEQAANLFRLIGLQSSVPLYHAAGEERGAVMDALDAPLNDRGWIEAQVAAAMQAGEEGARLRALAAIPQWADAGRGGTYDDLGDPGAEPHLAREGEPPVGCVRATTDEHSHAVPGWRQSWNRQASTLYGMPLRMRWRGLDPASAYTVRVVYTGRFHAAMRLTANGTHEVHGPLRGTADPAPMEFALPREATATRELRLQWDLVEGRGCQVAEVWLLRK